jgi:hypothetical protein
MKNLSPDDAHLLRKLCFQRQKELKRRVETKGNKHEYNHLTQINLKLEVILQRYKAMWIKYNQTNKCKQENP